MGRMPHPLANGKRWLKFAVGSGRTQVTAAAMATRVYGIRRVLRQAAKTHPCSVSQQTSQHIAWCDHFW